MITYEMFKLKRDIKKKKCIFLFKILTPKIDINIKASYLYKSSYLYIYNIVNLITVFETKTIIFFFKYFNVLLSLYIYP